MNRTEKEIALDKESTICFLSSDLQFLIREFRKKLKKEGFDSEMNQDLSLISEKVRLVQRKAQKMEKRLKKYRDAIESLGFVRKK